MRGFVRLDPATGDITGFFSCPSEPDRVTYAYTPSGGSFYSFDKKSRKLARYAAWW